MVSKQEILDLIRETAEANGGSPLGQAAFASATGVREHQWRGLYAVRWSDLLGDAGYTPNKFNSRRSDEDMARHLAILIRRAGHFPSSAERKMAMRDLDDFPSETTFQSRGGQRNLAMLVVAELRNFPEYADVVEIVDRYIAAHPLSKAATTPIMPPSTADRGHVYLIKTPRGHRIGMTTRAVGSRLAEHENQQGEAELLHRIVTDDPLGVERYWHQRFADKRSGTSDHFNLTASDVNAFKRWKKIF